MRLALSPWQFIVLAAFSFFSLSCGGVIVFNDWVISSGGRGIVGLTVLLGLLLAPAVCIGTFFDVLRRGWDWRLVVAGVFAGLGLVMFFGIVYLKLREYGL